MEEDEVKKSRRW